MSNDVPLSGFAPGVPTQEKADMFNPRQFAAWVFAVGTPDSRENFNTFQPPLIPSQSWQKMSEVLWKLGFRHVPAKQTHWVIPGNNWAPGRLVDKKPEPAEMDLETVAEFFKDTSPEIFEKVITMKPEDAEAHGNEMLSKLRQITERADILSGTIKPEATGSDTT